MTNKLIGVAAIALSSAFISTGALAHVAGGALISGSGSAVASTYEKCVIVSSGSHRAECAPTVKKAKKIKKVKKVVAKPAPRPAPAPEPTAIKVTLAGDALFATNSAAISAEGQAALNEFTARAQAIELTHIDVIGYADSRGAEQYNLNLSVKRAMSVKGYLESKGIPASIIFASGKGEASPVASNLTKEGRAQNRRVDIIVSGLQ